MTPERIAQLKRNFQPTADRPRRGLVVRELLDAIEKLHAELAKMKLHETFQQEQLAAVVKRLNEKERSREEAADIAATVITERDVVRAELADWKAKYVDLHIAHGVIEQSLKQQDAELEAMKLDIIALKSLEADAVDTSIHCRAELEALKAQMAACDYCGDKGYYVDRLHGEIRQLTIERDRYKAALERIIGCCVCDCDEPMRTLCAYCEASAALRPEGE